MANGGWIGDPEMTPDDGWLDKPMGSREFHIDEPRTQRVINSKQRATKPKPKNDAEYKAYWETITNPREALEQIVEHSYYLGTDSYYADMNEALLAMAGRIVGKK